MSGLCPQVGLQVSAAGWAPGSAGGVCMSECGRVSWSMSELVWVLEWMCCWGTAVGVVLFGPGLAQKPWLWPGLRGLWLSQKLGQAKAPTHGLALAWLGPSHGFQ